MADSGRGCSHAVIAWAMVLWHSGATLAGNDADLYNLTAEAVREDALAAALTLAALAAAAVQELADVTGRTPQEALESLHRL